MGRVYGHGLADVGGPATSIKRFLHDSDEL